MLTLPLFESCYLGILLPVGIISIRASQLRFRRARAVLLMESLEPRTLLPAALVQTFSAVPPLTDIITPQNTTLKLQQFNPATGTLLGAKLVSSTDAHIKIDATILNTELNQ